MAEEKKPFKADVVAQLVQDHSLKPDDYKDVNGRTVGFPVRQFETGATRDTEQGKFDYEGFLSPRVLERYGQYMHKHRHQSDGTLRDSDNWQKGIPLSIYIKSLWRHFFDLWKIHRGLKAYDNHGPVDLEDAACGIMFNVMGYLHEYLKAKASAVKGCDSQGGTNG